LAGAITLAGAFFRFYALWRIPAGLYFDEAANLFDIFGLGPNYHPIYFPNNNGREALFFYWAALFARPLAVSPYAMRVASAFLGVATIPAIYFCLSQMLRKSTGRDTARRVALFGAAVCAFLYFHVTFSRLGLRTISLPLFECLAFGLLWQGARLRSWQRFLAGGALLGLSLYTYTAARLLIAGVAVYAIYCLLFQRRGIYWRGALLAAAACLAVMAPLARYASDHRDIFFERTEGVAVTDPSAVWHSTLAVLAMFNFHGTDEGLQNIAGMPMFDPWMGIVFLAGLALCLWRLRQPPYVFALIWLASIVPASALSPRAPYYLRLTGLIPPAVFLAALGLAELPVLLERLRRLPRAALYAPSIALVAASGGWTFQNYFQVWASSSDAFYGSMQDKVDALPYLQRWQAGGDMVFLAPLYAQDWTYRWLTRDVPLQSFEAKDCTLLPPAGRAATYVYPSFDKDQPPLLLSHLPGSPAVENVANSRGDPNLIAIHEAAAQVPPPPGQPIGAFGGQLALDHADIPAGPFHPGDTVTISLTWRALGQVDSDYTVFIHADDNVSKRRIQRDSRPCGGSIGTSHWLPGEQARDAYAVAIPSDAPSGTYVITTGVYATTPEVRNLKLDGKDGTDLEAGSFTVAR
jgi:hypothetical protein